VINFRMAAFWAGASYLVISASVYTYTQVRSAMSLDKTCHESVQKIPATCTAGAIVEYNGDLATCRCFPIKVEEKYP